MKIKTYSPHLFALLLALSSAPIAIAESLWSKSEWPDPELLHPAVVGSASVLALIIGHTSAIGLKHYWKTNKNVFGSLLGMMTASLGILSYTSLVHANRETRLQTFSLLGLATVTATLSSCVGQVLHWYIQRKSSSLKAIKTS